MTGKALTVHQQAQVVMAAEDKAVNRSALARELGISRQWLSVLIGRVESEGIAGFEPMSRAPVRTRQIDPAVEDAIVRLRKELTDEGLSGGAAAIQWHLEQAGFVPVPSVSTIARRLKARGLVVAMPKRRPKSSWVRFEFPAPNACWQIDFTHWALRNGRAVVIMNVIDDHSRVCVASVAAPSASSRLAWQAFSAATQTWGVPARVLSDNGVEFCSRAPSGGLFDSNLRTIGVALIHSRIHHPQTCGKVERLHQTTKKYLRAHAQPRSVVGLQRLLDTWRDRYNHSPHQGIKRRTPHQRWHASPAERPGPPTLTRDERVTVLHATGKGRIELKPWQIPLGNRWAGHDVHVFVDDLDVAIFTSDGQVIRTLRIDPSRRYQSLTNT